MAKFHSAETDWDLQKRQAKATADWLKRNPDVARMRRAVDLFRNLADLQRSLDVARVNGRDKQPEAQRDKQRLAELQAELQTLGVVVRFQRPAPRNMGSCPMM
jgi:hypothetical protein